MWTFTYVILICGFFVPFVTANEEIACGGGPHDIRAVHKDVYVLRNSYVTLQLPIHDGDIQWMVRPLSKWQLYKYRHSLEDNKVAIGPIDEDLNNITVIASYKEKNRHGKVQRYVNASITLRLGEKDVEIMLDEGYWHKQSVQAVLGRKVKVTCFQVKGKPSPHLTVYKQQTITSFSVVPQEKYHYASGCLFMGPITKKDSGSYQFAVSNCFMETHVEFTIDAVDVDCGPLPVPENGAITGNKTILDSVLQFYCFEGYNLNGSSSRECQRSGQWTGVNASCEAVDCGHPPLLANGDVLTNSTIFGSVAQFVCLDGYRLSGNPSVVCEADAKWKYSLPWCERVCSHLETIENGMTIVEDVAVNGTATFSCNVGYNLFGSPTRKCQPNGKWDGDNAYCQIVDCGILIPPTNGQISVINGATTYGSHVELFCNTGYKLTGSQYRFCQANGSWTGQMPSCPIVDCGPMHSPLHGTVSEHNTTYSSLVNISCDVSYLLVGQSLKTCQADGKWSGEDPVCHPDPCFLNPCLNGGTCLSSAALHGDNIKFHCNCTSLFDGQLCETVLATGCTLVPCFPGVACTDHANGSFTCDSCPSGLIGDGIDCVTNKTHELIVVVPLDAETLTNVQGCNISVILIQDNDTSLLFFEMIAGDNGTFAVPRGEMFIVTGEAQGYLSTSSRIIANPDEDNLVRLYLRKKAPSTTIVYDSSENNLQVSYSTSAPSDDDTISNLTQFTVDFPEDALDVQNGTVVNISLTGVDPTISLAGVPELIAVEVNGNESFRRVNLNSLALAEMTIQDSTTGQEVGLKKPVQLTLPLNPSLDVSNGDIIPAWYFNRSSGAWIQEGYGTVVEMNGQNYWKYNASHFTWWNCDAPWTDKNCVRVRVSYGTGDMIQPVSSASVHLQGQDFSYSTSGITDAHGQVCFNFKRNSNVKMEVNAANRGFFSKPMNLRGREGPSLCQGSRDWESASQSEAGDNCQEVTFFCSCDCVENGNGAQLPTITLSMFSATPSSTAIINLSKFITMINAESCIRQRWLLSRKQYTIVGNSVQNVFLLEGDVLHTSADYQRNLDVSSVTINIEVTLFGEENEGNPDACRCDDISLQVTVIMNILPGETRVQIPWTFKDGGLIGGGQAGASRVYSDPNSVPESPWTVTNGGLHLKFDFEDSSTCPNGLDNPNVQTGSATAVVHVLGDSKLTVMWEGYGEVVSLGFEKLVLSVDGQTVATATSPGPAGDTVGAETGSESCRIGPVISNPSSPLELPLGRGNHEIIISLTTVDSNHHEGASYSFYFSLS